MSLVVSACLAMCAPMAFAAPAEVEVHALATPQAVTGSDGAQHLAYELDITNVYTSTGVLKLAAVDVMDADGRRTLARFAGDELASLLPPGTALADDKTLAINGGGHAFVLVWLTLPKGTPVPARLYHHLEFRTATGAVDTVDGVPVAVETRPPVRLGAPLRGGLWLADEGPGNAQSHHWGSLVAENGVLTIPQRYAIDFFGLDSRGHAVSVPIDKLGDSQPADWAGYDAEILAVADGVVRGAQDGVPEHKMLAPQVASEMTPKALYGNFVILEIAPHVFVHYAHMRPGSVTVKIGATVHRGDVLGHLSFTGGAGAPHLHMHVSDTAGFGQSQGLPFVFDGFTLKGRSTESDVLNRDTDLHLTPTAARPVRDALPLNGDLVTF
ncbi:hypothetical protein AEAC466_19130 [Asticcacaulis sp. AC466]|uniref:M23 family metallopeptidase n=1 Tax=Asticcacaulis sp. AC466 TaxID=1282362 RepID=UPI0003C3F1D2|nr:M23 family metallopeptidase [Asticcacaulis sp. AC466]ESQ82033.1 hypothetical protein AEAC466_19130 [Asticcacaulis sp. AC466]